MSPERGTTINEAGARVSVGSSRVATRIAWFAFVCGLILQGLLFRQFCVREVVPVFPRGYDQTVYLGITYDLYESIREGGFREGLASLRYVTAPQGVLLEAEAALAQFVEGPGRLAALETNFAHLVLFEIALLAVASWLGRPWLGLALCGLLMSASSLYHDVGGLDDFRLDFAAFCLFGTLLCIAIRSAFFRSTASTLLFGLTAGALILTRTIYAVYLAPGLLALTVLLLVFRKLDHTARLRVANLVLAGSLLTIIGVPSLLARWQEIRAYYLVGGHRSEAAARRAREFAVTTLDHLTYYARSAILEHGGVTFLFLGACVVLALALPRKRPLDTADTERSESEPGDSTDAGLSRRDAWIGATWLSFMAVVVYVLLTSDIWKSPVVGSVFLAMVIPAVLLLPSLVRAPRERAGWRMAVWLLVFLTGQEIFASHMGRRGEISPDTLGVILPDGPDVREHGRVMDIMGRLCQHVGLASPTVSFDAASEFTHVGVLKTMAFERLHVSLTPTPALGELEVGMSQISATAADQLLDRSDFALLGLDRDPYTPGEGYPLNISLRELGPHLYEKAARDMVRVEDAAFFGRHMTLFMRPLVRCSGDSGGWITNTGVECHTAGAVLKERPVLRLRGASNLAWLGGLPKVTARIKQGGKEVATMPCEVVAAESNTALRPYTIACDVRSVPVTASAPATVTLSFDRHFVPRQIGLNGDVRQLVLAWPKAIDAQRSLD